MEYPWYTKLVKQDYSLLQGDLINNCPILIPPKKIEENNEIIIDIKEYDVVIISQSCDLEQNKLDIVLVCPYEPFSFVVSKLPKHEQSKRAKTSFYKQLKQGLQPNYHLLNKKEDFGISEHLVVDFRNVYGVHLEFLKEHVKNSNDRIRLLPPYREHLSQAFARFFMRVGLPQSVDDIII